MKQDILRLIYYIYNITCSCIGYDRLLQLADKFHESFKVSVYQKAKSTVQLLSFHGGRFREQEIQMSSPTDRHIHIHVYTYTHRVDVFTYISRELHLCKEHVVVP